MSMRKTRYGLTRGVWLLVALSAALNISCGNSIPEVLRDTTGATFSLTCAYNEGCAIKPLDAPPPVPCNSGSGSPGRVFYSHFWHRFIEICSAVGLDSGAWFTDPSMCRFVACDADDECPQFSDVEYVCSGGLCQNVERKGEISDPGDVVTLCMADEPRPSDCRAQTDDPEVAAQFERAHASCDSATDVCKVPADCWQP
ncbi:hypothetical protein [Polyangium jinanense]|uniref:Uncharacterized protein n=1 Tax=Polyangium jinanense TaxID=2829994 RepID=A0A9X3XEM3_9BACT|nr:hypothetical protein [Polyangium jinanense]MDC3986611.1 hypothetical protein [Polyangium jinanense]